MGFALFAPPWLVATAIAAGTCDHLLHGQASEEFRTHAVETYATVIDHSVNGFGGDPLIDYEYVVDGVQYKGYAISGKSDIRDVWSKPVGLQVPIEYSSIDPDLSCACHAKAADLSYLPTDGFHPSGFANLLPALVLALLTGGAVVAAERRRRPATQGNP